MREHFLVEPLSRGKGVGAVFRVEELLGYHWDALWAVCHSAKKRKEKHLYGVQNGNNDRLDFIRLTSSMRKILSLHACPMKGKCAIDAKSNEILHSNTIHAWKYMVLLGRKDGYRPCRA